MSPSSNSGPVWIPVGVTSPSLKYTGPWQEQIISGGKNALKGIAQNGNVTMKFTGSQVRVKGHLASGNLSTSRYHLDDNKVTAKVAIHGAEEASQFLFWSSTLSGADHTLVVEHNTLDGGSLWLDDIDVLSIQKMDNDMTAGSMPSTGPSSSSASQSDNKGSNSNPKNPTSSSASVSSKPSSASQGGPGPPSHGLNPFPPFCVPGHVCFPMSSAKVSHGKEVSGGAIAGIVVACVGIIGVILGYVLFMHRRKRQREYPVMQADDASTTTIVRIVSYADSDTLTAPTEPTNRKSFIPWLRKERQEPLARTNTSSVVLTTVFAPTMQASSDMESEKWSPGPAPAKQFSPPPLPELPYYTTYTSPNTPRTAPARYSWMNFR